MSAAAIDDESLTTPEAARELDRDVTAVRRAADRLGLGRRFGLYRVLSRADLPLIADDLARRPERRGGLRQTQATGV